MMLAAADDLSSPDPDHHHHHHHPHEETDTEREHSVVPKRLSHLKDCLSKLIEFLNPYLPLANSNVTDFITENQWKQFLPLNIQQELLNLTEDQLKRLPNLHEEPGFLENNSLSTIASGKCTLWTHESLASFLKDARDCSLEQMDVLTKIPDLEQELHLDFNTDLFPMTFMSQKKSHEVEVMSRLCYSLCKKFQIQTVIDLGSGKGYLGVHLADNYGLQVLGIDSSTIHTLGAQRRASILKKQQRSTRNERNCKSNKIHKPDNKKTPSITDEQKSIIPSHKNDTRGLYLSHAAYVDTDTDIVELLPNDFDVGQLDGKIHTLITGLHTCGNLGPTLLRLFTVKPAARVLCNVSCCYHLIDEEAICTDQAPSEIQNGFPMSSFLKKRKFELGRGARNLASQSVSRNMSSVQLQGNSLFQRALLQKIIQDTADPEFKKPKETSKLRKLGNKCSTFLEYVTKAFQKLGFSSEHICNQLIEDFLLKYEDQKKMLAAFFQLKTSLAPCIEAIIILDRLYFLLENGAVLNAHICQLFDTLISPRCYGIIAYK